MRKDAGEIARVSYDALLAENPGWSANEELLRDLLGPGGVFQRHVFSKTVWSSTAFVASAGDRLIGQAVVSPRVNVFMEKPFFFWDSLYVETEYRGCGVAKRLAGAVYDFVIENGGALDWTVDGDNEGTLKFHRKFGAEPHPTYRYFSRAVEELIDGRRRAGACE